MINPLIGHPKILLIGSLGQLGFELSRSLAPVGALITLTRSDLDLMQTQSVIDVLDLYAPDFIVNAAAYTQVDQAESDQILAYAINSDVPKILARWAAAHQSCLVHYSTDYVFDGQKSSAYCENDLAYPLSVYGNSKLQGEINIRNELDAHFIFRTSWLYGAYGNNFLKTMLHLMQTQRELRVVNDQVGTPTSTRLLADMTAYIVRDSWLKWKNGLTIPYGTYHLTAKGETSWHGYAQLIAQQAIALGWQLKMAPYQINPVLSSEYPSLANRPKNSRLDTRFFRETFGLDLPNWQDEVKCALQMLKDAH